MAAGAWVMVGVLGIIGSTVVYLLLALIRSIKVERSQNRSLWREFGLGIGLMLLFFISWLGHGVAEWQVFTDEQREHGESTGVGDFLAEFAQSTLENWQSEFLQLFSFVVLATLYIHKGSAESKDGEEQIEASLRRIETHLGTLPASAPSEPGDDWKLPPTQLEAHDATSEAVNQRR